MASAAGSMAYVIVVGTMRIRSVPTPAMRSPFSMLECACDVEYATSVDVSPSPLTAPPAPATARQHGHQRRLARRALDHPAAGGLVERKRSGRPSSSSIQSSTSVSSSVHAGPVTQLMPCTPSPAASSSPRIDGYEVFDGK